MLIETKNLRGASFLHIPPHATGWYKLSSIDLLTIELVVMCGGVADSPSRYGELNAERAAEFKRHWVSLQTPPHPILKEQQKKEDQLSKLHEEIAEFLAGIL